MKNKDLYKLLFLIVFMMISFFAAPLGYVTVLYTLGASYGVLFAFCYAILIAIAVFISRTIPSFRIVLEPLDKFDTDMSLADFANNITPVETPLTNKYTRTLSSCNGNPYQVQEYKTYEEKL